MARLSAEFEYYLSPSSPLPLIIHCLPLPPTPPLYEHNVDLVHATTEHRRGSQTTGNPMSAQPGGQSRREVPI